MSVQGGVKQEIGQFNLGSNREAMWIESQVLKTGVGGVIYVRIAG